MHEEFLSSKSEHDKQQQEIAQILEFIGQMLANEYDRKIEHYKDRFKNKPWLLDLCLKYKDSNKGSFQLPGREGYQTLDVDINNFESSNLDPDVLARVMHNESKEFRSGEVLQRIYYIKTTPDRDFVIDTSSSILDISSVMKNPRDIKVLEEFFQSCRDSAEDNKIAAEQEKRMGLHATTEQDIEELKLLLKEARHD